MLCGYNLWPQVYNVGSILTIHDLPNDFHSRMLDITDIGFVGMGFEAKGGRIREQLHDDLNISD